MHRIANNVWNWQADTCSIFPQIIANDHITIFKVTVHFQNCNVIIHWMPGVKFGVPDDTFYTQGLLFCLHQIQIMFSSSDGQRLKQVAWWERIITGGEMKSRNKKQKSQPTNTDFWNCSLPVNSSSIPAYNTVSCGDYPLRGNEGSSTEMVVIPFQGNLFHKKRLH